MRRDPAPAGDMTHRANGRPSGFGRIEVWLVHSATVLVGSTGVAYAVMRYLLRPTDEFAVVNHPWQPAIQHLHVLFAAALVFAAGVLWRAHARPALRNRIAERSHSGWVGLLTLVPMAASGYLVQVSVAEGWRLAWTIVHVATSVLWLAAYGFHQLGAKLDRSGIRR